MPEEGEFLPVESHFLAIDWIVLGVYLVGIIGVGAYFTKRQTTTSEFFVASKRMHWLPVSLSIVASLFSAVSFLGQPARVFRTDSIIAWYAFSVAIITPIIMYMLLPFYRRLDITSAYEYLEHRFGLNVRLLASSLFILKRLFWMALVCLAPSLALSTITGLRVEWCILLIGIGATLYTGLGGMSAVIWTDAIQFVVLTVGQLLMVGYIVSKLDGGFGEMWRLGVDAGRIIPDMSFSIAELTLWPMLITGMVFALSDLGADQVTVQRLMTTKDEKEARKSLIFNAVFKFPGMAAIIGIGIALFAFYQTFPERLTLTEDQYDKVVPYFIVKELPPGISGFLIAAIFAAAMSSFDSGLNCIVTAFTVDWYKRLYRPNLEDIKYLILAKALTFALGAAITVLSIAIYRTGIENIIDASNTYLGFFGGALLGIFLLGVATRRTKALPTVFGAIASVAIVIGLDTVGAERQAGFLGTSIHPYWYGFISCALTMLIGYLGSFIGPELAYDKVREFTMARKKE